MATQQPRCSYQKEIGVFYLLRHKKDVFGGRIEDLSMGHSRINITSAFHLAAFIALAALTLVADCYAECCTGEIRPKSGATSQDTYVWDGKELKAKSGATSETTWLFDGKELRKKVGATASNTYLWTSTRFKPKSGATAANTWIWSRNELKPQAGAKSANTWVFERCEWSLKQRGNSQNSWAITGFVPVPVCALVILGLN